MAPGERGQGLRVKALAIIEMMKPKQLLLLMITMYGAYFAAGGGLDPVRLSLLTLTGIGSAGGVTALNMYLEVDIDSLMERTRGRPLPTHVLEPGEALYVISLLILLGTVSGYLINEYVAFAALAGFYFDIVAYTEVAKRRTEWALILGSVAGSMPALGGWAAGYGGLGLVGVLLAGIVFAWQPLHVAFIHYYYEDQYEKAGIPTIPSRLGARMFARLALASVASVAALSWLIVFTYGAGLVASVLVSLLAVMAFRAIARFEESPGRNLARAMIKFASPMVGVVFILLPIEAHLGILV